MKEAFCSFNLAKLLDEAGFIPSDDCVVEIYNEKGESVSFDDKEAEHFYQAPTHQVALQWLREARMIHIESRYSNISLSNLYAINRYYGVAFDMKHGKWLWESTLAPGYCNGFESVEKAIEFTARNVMLKFVLTPKSFEDAKKYFDDW